MDSNERKKKIKTFAEELIRGDQDVARLKARSLFMAEKNSLFGRNLVYLAVLTSILGLYLHDHWWQVIFIFFSLTLATIGFWQTENPLKRPFRS